MEDLTGRQFGPYQIVAPLGEGGMAAVYKAYQPAMERYVALKVLPRHFANDPQFTARFEREAKLLAKLQHPHILPVYDFGQADGYSYIVMPFVSSGTLTELLTNGSVSLPRIREIIVQVGSALNYAHAHGMIHRDVKPSNILVDESGNCLLTDFGLARMVDTTSNLTNSGATVGTPAYMSPEQGSGRKVDGRSDIYSLGVILYEMATGRVPYKAETPIAVIFKHIQDPLPPARTFNPNLSEAVELIILKALSKSPEDRYQTAGDLVSAMQTAVPDTLFLSSRQVKDALQKPKGKMPTWAWFSIGIIALFILIGGISLKFNKNTSAVNPPAASTNVNPTNQSSTSTKVSAIPTIQPVLPNTQNPLAPDPREDHRIASACGEKSVCILDGLGKEINNISLPELPGSIIYVGWSPDGKKLLLTVSLDADPQGHGDLFIYDISSKGLAPLVNTEKNEIMATWSPDGKWIAAHSDCTALITAVDKTNAYTVAKDFQTCVVDPRWSPDSKWIAWASTSDKNGEGGQSLQVMNLESLEVKVFPMEFTPGEFRNLAWSPDGSFLYLQLDMSSQILTLKLNTSCLLANCTKADQQFIEFEIPANWLPNYFPQWADTTTSIINSSTTQPAISQFGNALQITDINAYGKIPYSPTLDLRKAITLEAWVKVQKFPNPCKSVWAESCGYVPIISQGYRRSAAGNFTLAVGQKGLLFTFEIIDSRLMAYADIPENEWIHIAISHTYGDGARTTFYLNGNPVEDAQWMNDRAQPISGDRDPEPNSGSDYYIGQYGSEKPGDDFIGELDDLRIWNTARTQEEILAHMNSELAGNEPGLVAYWNFNVQPGETVIPDASGNDHKVFLNGNTNIIQR